MTLRLIQTIFGLALCLAISYAAAGDPWPLIVVSIAIYADSVIATEFLLLARDECPATQGRIKETQPCDSSSP